MRKQMGYHRWISHSCYLLILPVQLVFRLSISRYLQELLEIGSGLLGIAPTVHSVLADNEEPAEIFAEEHIHHSLIERRQATMSPLVILSSSQSRQILWHLFKISGMLALGICIVGYMWYIAVNLISMANLTAIYNTSCFFTYVFSIFLLGERVRLIKCFAVALSIIGVLIMTVWFSRNDDVPIHNYPESAETRTLGNYKDLAVYGNLIAIFGASCYGLYEVLYKKYASPITPSILFANTLTGFIGVFTLLVLWIPIPILHFLGVEPFVLPSLQVFAYILLAALAGVCFNANFMLVIAFTNPLFASIGIMLTIPIVAVVDMLITHQPLPLGTVFGGLCILVAFGLLTIAENR